VASSGALAPRFASVAAVWVGAPPPSDESMREALARQINDDGLLGGGSSVSSEIHVV
jgi:hypothetical protein